MAATIDVASHGRVYAGLGAGWSEHEWKAYGYPWTSQKERMGSFVEAVELIHRLWTEDHVVFNGTYHSVDRSYVVPRRQPKLWIGGGGERVTLKLVAKYGEASNFGTGRVDVIEHKLDVLRQHCEDAGRDYDEIIKSTGLNVFPIETGADPLTATAKARGRYSLEEFAEIGSGGTSHMLAEVLTTKQLTDDVEQLAEAGVDYVLLSIPGVAYDHQPLQLFAEDVVPVFS
jgi:alkanesulfonate monooxygenase SsuD/methylene tetrahydromethanopterin reductase-like flavin-dependent oxidoreductase (luciferase family)